ncbi:MAG: hypothetical protein K6G68_06175 [Oscillospiraceae bacterium]|nr:hypothetical protein [Oscillospiraceae bacterium]MBQ4487637.1 hypothetical protein [Oscillospiraceae bacterium]MCR5806603.1 hypothetical protein [Oscillospiraceae bacterium]
MSSSKGLAIARAILLLVVFSATTASVIIMIIQFVLGMRERSGYRPIRDKDEIPF